MLSARKHYSSFNTWLD